MYDNSKGIIVINGNIYSAEDVLDAVQAEALLNIKQSGEFLLIGNRRIEPIKTSIENEASAITCYGSLSYCCGLEKPCVERDLALKLLGLTKEDYKRLKSEFHKCIINAAKERMSSKEADLGWISSVRVDNEEIIDVEGETENEETVDLSSLFTEPSESNVEEPEFNFEILENLSVKGDSNRVDNRRSSNDDYCAICGAKVGEEAQFCPECGERLGKQREFRIENTKAF